ncbi:DUF2817 domain-containing protein [Nocardioidaceae bacterium]|nr:DUF2817 domain-containing protein [Nocardioidaceae bacterium]
MTRPSSRALAAAAGALLLTATGPGVPGSTAVAPLSQRSADRLPDAGRVEIGRSVQDRPIHAWRVGDAGARRTVVLVATLHGDEPAPRRILRRLRQGPEVSGVDLWVVPVANPDGLAARTRQNARGVDLNRNFRESWAPGARDEKYPGHRAASEPETRALARFLARVDPDRVLSYHQPLLGVDTYEQKRPAFTRRVATALGLPLRSFDCRGGCHGTLTQWFNARRDGTALTVEYGRGLTRAGVRRGVAGVLEAIGARR